MASSRKTYDTDVITLRTVFAKDLVNSNIPALRVLTADGNGGTYWAIPSSLGLNPSFNEIITTAGTYTADLSYNRFRLLAGEGIGMVTGPVGSNQTTLFAKAFSKIDVVGENSFSAFQNNFLNGTINISTTGVIQARADPATNTLFIDGPVSNPYIVSTGQYGFYQIKVTPETSTITSSIQGWAGDFITASSPSTVFNLIGYNDIKLSTNVTTNSIYFSISTFTSEDYLQISTAAFTAYPNSISTVSSIYTPLNVFNSTITSFSSFTGFTFSSVVSSIDALAMSTGNQFFILTGLINACATTDQLNFEVNQINNQLISTTFGTDTQLISTTAGLIASGSSGITPTELISTTFGTDSQLLSSIAGVGTGSGGSSGPIPFLSSFTVSTGSLFTSTITTSSIFNTGTVSTHSLVVYGPSTLTVQGLSFFQNIVSSYAIVSDRVGVLDLETENPIYIAVENGILTFGGIPATDQIVLNSTILGVNNDLISTTFGSDTQLISTTLGLEMSASSNFTSTIQGLGTYGYLSSLTGFQVSTGFIQTSTVNFFDVDTNDLNTLYVSGQTLLLNGNFITGGAGGGGGGGVTKIIAGTNISISPAGGIGDVTINNTGPNSNNLISTTFGIDGQLLSSMFGSDSQLISTTAGIFASGTGGGITTDELVSTTFGIDSQLISSMFGSDSQLISTTAGIFASGTGGGITTEELVSTTFGIDSQLISSMFGSDGQLISSMFGSDGQLLSSMFGSDGQLISSMFASDGQLISSMFASDGQLISSMFGSDSQLLSSMFGSDSQLISTTAGIFASGTGGGITTEELVSTTFGADTQLISTTFGITSEPPSVSVVVSTLDNEDATIFQTDIGKYFLFTQNNPSRSINLPSVENGWNVVIKNMPESSDAFTVNTTTPVVLAPNVTTTIVSDGFSFYSL